MKTYNILIQIDKIFSSHALSLVSRFDVLIPLYDSMKVQWFNIDGTNITVEVDRFPPMHKMQNFLN